MFFYIIVANSNPTNGSQYMLQENSPAYSNSASTVATAAAASLSNNTPTVTVSSSSPSSTPTPFNMYQAINPMDINRNYAATATTTAAATTNSESYSSKANKTAARPPTTLCLPTTKATYLATSSQQPTIKRGKFTHNHTTATTAAMSNGCLFRIKQENIAINSDGESIVSNESDSNSSTFRYIYLKAKKNAIYTNLSVNFNNKKVTQTIIAFNFRISRRN